MTDATDRDIVAKGWMLFATETPVFTTMRPHPGYAPDADAAAAGDWTTAYGLHATLAEAQADIDDDLSECKARAREEDADTDVSEMEADMFPMYVSVTADGGIGFHENPESRVEGTATIEMIFGAFGMPVPEVDPAPALEV